MNQVALEAFFQWNGRKLHLGQGEHLRMELVNAAFLEI
jgi:hypothetical protein